MKIRSFRVRIAMLSVLCSSVVLLGSSLFAWDIMWESELRRADQFIGGMLRPNLSDGFRPPPGPHPPDDGPDGPMMEGHPRGERPSGGRFRGERFPGPRPMEPRWPEGRRPWMRPPWDRGPRDRDEGTSSSRPSIFYQIKDLEEPFTYRSDNWPAALTESRVAITSDSTVRFSTIHVGGKFWRVGAGGNGRRSMIVGLDLESVVALIKQVASAFLLSIPVALGLIALGAVFMARRALRPVGELTRMVERITARGLGERIESQVKDAEFEKLIRVFNQMMDRLERSFTQATRFSADAAHELRTPITILQGHVERMLQRAQPASPMQQGLGEMVDELHRIKSILEKLLLLARMDAGQFQVYRSPLCLSTVLESIVEDIQALAPEVVVESRIEPGIQVEGDAALLETAIQNLGSNAVKYNLTERGRIEIELTRQGETALLAISNTGPGISAGEREKIFERFYRTDQSRSRETDGLGLGLSLAREIVQAHHGTLELAESGGGGGVNGGGGAGDGGGRGGRVNRFEMRLPLMPVAD